MSRSIAFCLTLCMILASFSHAQGQDKPIKGTIQAGVHQLEFSPDYVYQVIAKSEGDGPELSLIRPGDEPFPFHLGQPLGHERGSGRADLVYSPTEKTKLELRVRPREDAPPGPQEYTLTLQRHKLDRKPIFEFKGELTETSKSAAGDAAFSRPYSSVHRIKLVKGINYIVEMSSDSNAVLYPACVRDVAGQRDFVSAGVSQKDAGKPARCVVIPQYDGDYQLIAGVYLAQGLPCDYVIKVFQAAKQ